MDEVRESEVDRRQWQGRIAAVLDRRDARLEDGLANGERGNGR